MWNDINPLKLHGTEQLILWLVNLIEYSLKYWLLVNKKNPWILNECLLDAQTECCDGDLRQKTTDHPFWNPQDKLRGKVS